MNLKEIRNKFNYLNNLHELKKNELNLIKDLTNELEIDSKDINRASNLLIEAGKVTQENIKFRLTSLVELALNTVLTNPPTFKIEIVSRRNQTEVDLLVDDNSSPIDACGGGALDLISFALRLSLWALDQSAKVFILDEPFRNVSHNYQEKVGELLKVLSDKLDIQFIIVSHQKNVDKYADRIFTITKN